MTKKLFYPLACLFLLGVLSSIVVASDQPHIVAWDFNDGVQRWWGRGSTAVSHNTFSIFASEGEGSLRISLFDFHAPSGWSHPVNLTIGEADRERLSGYDWISFDLYIPAGAALKGVRFRYWSFKLGTAVDITEIWSVWPEHSGWVNLSGPFNVEDWADVQTLIFDLLTPEGISIDDDIYLDNVCLYRNK
ncbi:MAG TPA: hypothetical protein GXX57_06545 [Firmicutes bacterium]|nr:hypothetical protein [Bacillota bacterium]